MGVRVNQVFAFLVIDEDGHEGVPGVLQWNESASDGGIYVAMMGADMTRVEEFRDVALHDPALQGKRITIARFSDREDIGVIDRTGEK